MSPEEEKLLVSVGAALLLLQTTEKVIKLCMTVVLPKSDPLTLGTLQRQEKVERKKTLGYFLTELRKRADLAPEFDATLEEFLEKRNIFIHNISDIPGWKLASKDGRAVAHQFVGRLIELNNKVLKVFIGLVSAWQKQIGLKDHISEEHAFFSEIDEQVVPLINDIFYAKAPNI